MVTKLTLFTTCRPFAGHFAVHQRNALASWALVEPRPEVVVFGDEDGAASACAELGLRHHPSVQRDEFGLPRLDFMFGRAQAMAGGGLAAYLNADVVVAGGLTDSLGRADRRFPGGFLAACRRWDVDMDGPLDFGGDWRGRVRGLIEAGGELGSPCSSDLLAWRPPLPWEMLPFVAGRPRWDNWMLAKAAEAGVPVVDLTRAVTLAHPHHGYGKDGAHGNRKSFDKGESSRRNKELAGGMVFCLKHVRRAGALWEMGEGGEIAKA